MIVGTRTDKTCRSWLHSANTLPLSATRNHGKDIDGAGNQNNEADIEWKETGARSFVTPANSNLDAAVNSDQREERHEHGYSDFDAPVGRTRPTGFFGCFDSL